jgi:hypothetical protein
VPRVSTARLADGASSASRKSGRRFVRSRHLRVLIGRGGARQRKSDSGSLLNSLHKRKQPSAASRVFTSTSSAATFAQH